MTNHAKTDLNEFNGVSEGETLNYTDRDGGARVLNSVESGIEDLRISNAYDDKFAVVSG